MQSITARLAGVALAVALSTGVAVAAPIAPATTNGLTLTAGGTPVQALFLFANAGDDSDLTVSVNGGAPIFLFSNSDSVTTNLTATGTQVSFAAGLGQDLVFTLNDQSVVNSWSTGPGSTNVAYIVNPLSLAAVNAALGVSIATGGALEASFNLLNTGNLVIIAYEDRPIASSDTDFNDLIFAFVPVAATPVPVPAALGLFGLGLLGLGAFVRGRRSA